MIPQWLVLFVMVLITIGLYADAQYTCPAIEADRRRDCYPWPQATEITCEGRGCLWCTDETPGVPWCFMDDTKCPSQVAEAQRADCHPEGNVSLESCTAKGCTYCESSTVGVPWCFFDSDVDQGGERCPAHIPENERIDCWPQNEPVDASSCVARGCYWCGSQTDGVPWCFQSRNQGYRISSGPTGTPSGQTLSLEYKNYRSWYGGDIVNLRVDAEFQEDHRLRLKIYDPGNNRYEVPVSVASGSGATNPMYEIEFSDDPSFNFKVKRKSTGAVLFDTSISGLIYSDQALMFGAKLPSVNIYGFGETEHRSFRHDLNWQQWGMWARDQPASPYNLYGVQPFFTALDANAEMFGCLILNSNAQEVVMTPAPGFTYRTTGGILDFYFFLGPEPETVISQYTEAIGRPYFPPYWTLGFQLARYGYDSLQEMQNAVNRLREHNIPQDVQYCDIDCFYQQLDFTYDTVAYNGLPQYVDQLKIEGVRFIVILDPCIDREQPEGSYLPYTRGEAAGAWLKNSDSGWAEGKVWPPGNVVFPDYSLPACQDWWIQECQIYHDIIKFDGLWIDMNEVANFLDGSPVGCSYNQYNNPIWKPRAVLGNDLYQKTVCMDDSGALGEQYNVHSLYGWAETEPSLRAARASTGGTRSLVLTRSTYTGTGQWAGHWLGDNSANWESMHYSIIGSLEFNLFGIPYIGADICGFGGDTTQELCLRWHQLGAFYTFARNHNGKGWIDHDPGIWEDVGGSTAFHVNIRYRLLPFLYTLFYESHVYGRTVMRPLMHEFVTDPNTYDIDRQFLWGPGLLITPCLTQGATTVVGYFPDVRWYDWHTGGEMAVRGTFTTVPAPRERMPLHVRGGIVFPMQQPANSTMFSRSNPMELLVAYDDLNQASGSLFWDEGDTVDTIENNEYFLATYSVNTGVLVGTVGTDGYPGVNSLTFENIYVLGQKAQVLDVTVNSQPHSDFEWDSVNDKLTIYALTVPVNSNFNVQWS